jgi:hypothetical protein
VHGRGKKASPLASASEKAPAPSLHSFPFRSLTPHPFPPHEKNTHTQPDCAQACADREGCTSYQYCGYGSYDDTCLFVTAPEGVAAGPTGGAQAAKGDCFLGTGHWRQVPTDKPYGGWTVGIACSSVAADPEPVAEGEDGDAAAPEDAPGPEPVVPVVAAAAKPAKAAPAPAPAKKAAAAPAPKKAAAAPAPATAPPTGPTKAGWAAALPADAPVKPVTVPTAITRGAPAPATAPPAGGDAAQPDLKTSSIKA